MELSITIPDSKKTRLINGICYTNGYEEKIPTSDGTYITNPESKADYAKRMVIQYMKNCVVSYESNRDAEEAKQLAIIKATSDISLS